jgi:hypothetical protein
MIQATKKQIIYWLGVIVVGIALGLALQFVRAWTEPTTAPPNGNVGAPVNTSSIWQTKWGQLFVNADLWTFGQQLVENLGLWVGGKVQADDFNPYQHSMLVEGMLVEGNLGRAGWIETNP